MFKQFRHLGSRAMLPALRSLAVCVAALCCLTPGMATNLAAYTEDWAPYNYAEGNEVKGIATDILRAACALAKRSCDISLVPWARAYKLATYKPNTMAFSMARQPAREKTFLWIGPILPRTTWVYVRADVQPPVQNMEDLAKLHIGVVRDEASQQDLVAAGVPLAALQQSNDNAEILKLVALGRVDAMVDTDVGMAWNLRNSAIDPALVTRAIKLSDGGAYYFGLNLNSDPALARDLQSAIDKLRQQGKIKAITNHYLGNAR